MLKPKNQVTLFVNCWYNSFYDPFFLKCTKATKIITKNVGF